MITLVVVASIWGGQSPLQTPKTKSPSTIQLQEKVYPLSKAMEITGDGTVLDGHGATLTGSGKGVGLHLSQSSHITIKNLNLRGFATGIAAQNCPELTLQNVTATNFDTAIRLDNVAGGLLQGIQAHGGSVGVKLTGCSKLIFEKSDVSQNSQCGIEMSGCTTSIVRDNRANAIAADSGTGTGISLIDCVHDQIMRNVAVRCRSFGIRIANSKPDTAADNTVQGNETSWTATGVGLSLSGESADNILDNTSGFCQLGYELEGVTASLVKGNLAVGCIQCGLKDELGKKNTYDSNVFVAESGGPLAVSIKGSTTVATEDRLTKNVFMGFLKPLRIENANPLTLQSNDFPWCKTNQLDDLAEVIGKKPIALDSHNDKPADAQDFVPANGPVAQLPSIYNHLGGVRMSSSKATEMEVVVEGSLSGAFQGEQEELARFKGQLPVELTFPPRFELFVRVREIAEKPSFITLFALLGDNSMARDMPADDSGDTLFKPGYAVDGDVTTTDNAWAPPNGNAGEWWEVDMKSDRNMTAFSVLPNPAHPDDFWKKFHIAVSTSGLFKGEETTVVTESDWLKHPGPERFYRFAPVTGRYIRIYGDVDQQGVQLKQFGVYGVKQ